MIYVKYDQSQPLKRPWDIITAHYVNDVKNDVCEQVKVKIEATDPLLMRETQRRHLAILNVGGRLQKVPPH